MTFDEYAISLDKHKKIYSRNKIAIITNIFFILCGVSDYFNPHFSILYNFCLVYGYIGAFFGLFGLLGTIYALTIDINNKKFDEIYFSSYYNYIWDESLINIVLFIFRGIFCLVLALHGNTILCSVIIFTIIIYEFALPTIKQNREKRKQIIIKRLAFGRII